MVGARFLTVKGVVMAWSESAVQRFVDPDFGPDPYFRRVAGRAECNERHLEYMFRIVWPFMASDRRVIVGQKAMTTYRTLGIFAVGDRDLRFLSAGHVLLSDYPGKGKTLLAGVPAMVLGGTYGRLQGDAELTPTDYRGNRIIDLDDRGKKYFRLIKGPAFSDFHLVDEVNRLSDDMMAAFLEVLCEGRITIFGQTEDVRPFVIMTMNPIETEGTRKLGWAFLDRIMFKLTGEWFTAKHYADILERTSDFKNIRRGLKQICNVQTVHEIREFFHETVYVDREIREGRVGRFVEISNDPYRFGYLQDISKVFGGKVILSGISGRGVNHWEGAAKALAAFRYREYATESDFLKVLLPIARHRIRFAPDVLDFFTEKWQDCPDTDATADKIIRQLIKEAW